MKTIYNGFRLLEIIQTNIDNFKWIQNTKKDRNNAVNLKYLSESRNKNNHNKDVKVKSICLTFLLCSFHKKV